MHARDRRRTHDTSVALCPARSYRRAAMRGDPSPTPPSTHARRSARLIVAAAIAASSAGAAWAVWILTQASDRTTRAGIATVGPGARGSQAARQPKRVAKNRAELGQLHFKKAATAKTTKAAKVTKDAPPPQVIVAVVDGGVDVSHPDFRGHLWVNQAEIPGNGV